MKKQLVWFFFAICFFSVVASCKKDDEEKDQRLVNKENKEAGEQFLINNAEANRDSVKRTFTGLQYKVNVPSTGIRPYPEDSVNVTYTGKLIDGTVFASATGENMLLVKQIEGILEGLQLMAEKATYTLYIPYYLAYNNSSRTVSYDGKTVIIQPYSVLIFEITLNSVVRRN